MCSKSQLELKSDLNGDNTYGMCGFGLHWFRLDVGQHVKANHKLKYFMN